MTSPEDARGPDERLRALFDEAVELEGLERSAFLDRRLEGDDALRRELEALLARHDAADGPIDRPLFAAATRDRLLSGAFLPPVVPGLRVLGLLGEGSASTVWAAEEEESRREVAVKVLRAGVASESTLRRFEVEIEALGRLDHPAIARILGSGRLDEAQGGYPFLVTERVDGVPLHVHLKERALDRDAALALLEELAEGVQHAHARGVLHRDLKPANVLVDRAGRPRIVDFGVARLSPGELDESSMHTRAGELIGTLAYMSPEQAAGRPEDVDARSDVYALGLLGFELLTGRRARDVGLLPLGEALRRIAEEEPTRLGRVRKDLAGEAETVFARALARDPEARYPTASEFAADVRRLRRGEPVEARTRSAWASTRSFVGRHRVLVAAAGLVLLVLVGAVVGTSSALVRARHEATRARAVTDFLKGVLVFVDPVVTGREPTVRDLLARASGAASERLAFDGTLEEEVRVVLGRAFDQIGDAAGARAEMQRLYELRRDRLGEDDRRTLGSRAYAGVMATAVRDLAAARGHLEEVLTRGRATLGPTDGLVLLALGELAELDRLEGRPHAAEERLEEALDLSLAAYGEDHRDTAECRLRLGNVRSELGRSAEAVPLYRLALKSRRASLGDEHPDTVSVERALGRELVRLHRLEEAEPLLGHVRDATARLRGDDHPDVAFANAALAELRLAQGRTTEAILLQRRAITSLRDRFGEDGVGTLGAELDLANALARAGELEEAFRLLERLPGAVAAARGADHPMLVAVFLVLANVERRRGELPAAAEALDRADALLVERMGPEHPERSAVFLERAHLARALGVAGAEEAYRQAERLARLRYDEGHPAVEEARRGLEELREGSAPADASGRRLADG